MTDGVKILTSHPTYKIGHFGDILPSQSTGTVLKKLILTQQKQTTQRMCISLCTTVVHNTA